MGPKNVGSRDSRTFHFYCFESCSDFSVPVSVSVSFLWKKNKISKPFLCHEIGFDFQFQYPKWEFYNIIVDGVSLIAILEGTFLGQTSLNNSDPRVRVFQ